jgi:uncharacterized protein (DUF2252 family)
LRKKVPLDAHAQLGAREPGLDPLELLRRQDAGRVPELLPIRYGRMVASPFTFYRGAAAVMSADLAGSATSGLRAQLCGDAHLSNFGVYATPERRLVFDMNDFDETLPGPFEWDVKRLAASVAVAGRINGHTGKERRATLRAVGRSYRQAMRAFAQQGNLAVWYANVDVERLWAELAPGLSSKARRRSRAAIERARSRDSAGALRKLTVTGTDGIRFGSAPPLIVPLNELFPAAERDVVVTTLQNLLRQYRRTLAEERRRLLDQYRLADIARKVVGVGSVGSRAYVLLLLGRDGADPLILQAKEARASVLEPYCGRSRHSNAGQRVVIGQRLVQAATDIFLGWNRAVGPDGEARDFYLRQLWDGKGSAVVEGMRPRTLTVYGEICGWTLARAHARTGDRVALGAYLGKKDAFEVALAEFAEAYADRTEADHARLVEAVAQGRVVAQADA